MQVPDTVLLDRRDSMILGLPPQPLEFTMIRKVQSGEKQPVGISMVTDVEPNAGTVGTSFSSTWPVENSTLTTEQAAETLEAFRTVTVS